MSFPYIMHHVKEVIGLINPICYICDGNQDCGITGLIQIGNVSKGLLFWESASLQTKTRQ